MGRSPPTEERVASRPLFTADITIRLQQLVAGWQGALHLSFASKFAHFFIDMERFPIYDSYAVKMVAYHLGRHGQDRKTEYPYKAFIEDLHRLRNNARLSCTARELDHYLWLAGLYQVWLRDPDSPINIEVKKLFELLSSATLDELTKLTEDGHDRK
jgi:hypothetical protein